MGSKKKSAVASSGTEAPWYQGWDISEEKREYYREVSNMSRLAKQKALRGEGPQPIHAMNVPTLDPNALMPVCPSNALRSLSLFSGGGGLDLGFERAGFEHVASFEILDHACETLRRNRPNWRVFSGSHGDVQTVDWCEYRGEVDVLHGGPPCQPFSVAGRQQGSDDVRDMVPEFVRAVLETDVAAFAMENVPALMADRFKGYLATEFYAKLLPAYDIRHHILSAVDFGIPQVRKRVFFIGLRKGRKLRECAEVRATHAESPLEGQGLLSLVDSIPTCMGAREALGLPDIGYDAPAPTLRSGLTGPRHTTSILSSTAALAAWSRLQIWPNGVARTREAARLFVVENGHFRLSVQDTALLQGFPEDWEFDHPVYKAIGQIGNAVPPPMAYHVAKSLNACFIGKKHKSFHPMLELARVP